MFFNYTAEHYEMQDSLLVCDRFLTDGVYNRGYVRQIWLFCKEC